MRISLLRQSITAYREGRYGDAGILKAAALAPASYPDIEKAVANLDEPLLDIHALAQRIRPTVGTLGWHYGQFIQRHQIEPLRVTSELTQALGRRNLVTARYILLHDVYHVLLGFDVSRRGELAVWSFVSAQRYNSAYGFAALLARWLYPILEPSSFGKLLQHYRLGFDAGLKTPCLLSQPIEKLWNTPLEKARLQIGLPHAGI